MITFTREEAQQVLDGLDDYWVTTDEGKELVETIRAKLSEPKPEPVAWMYVNSDGECEQIEYGEPFDDPSVTPLYTAPPQREWVGLTDEEYETMAEQHVTHCYFDTLKYAKGIEAKLKEKNV
jgi:hypothetical protein